MRIRFPLALAASLSLTASFAAAQCLNTINPFLSNNGGSVNGAVFFDLTVTSAVIVQSLTTNYGAAVNTPVGMQIYTIAGTYVGNTGSVAAWTLAGQDNGTSLCAGNNGVTNITLASPFTLNPGTYGVALIAIGSQHRYTNGVGTNQNFSDPFLAIAAGAAQNVPWSAGAPIANRVWNGSICYLPAAGIFPNFTGTPLSGPVNTNVQFTDTTYTSDPGGVISWQWDFQNDGIVDSAAQNPAFVYATEGVYSVRLTVADVLHGPATITKNGYVAIDVVDASFTANVVGGTTVQFTDTSAGGPTSWAWDFENDGIVDSNVQNPLHTYATAGAFNCRLTVTDAISNDTTTVNLGVGIIPVPGFGSTFASTVATRGLWFQSPTRFSIVSATVPNETNQTIQNVAIYRLAAAPPVFSATATGGLELEALNQPANAPIPCVVSFDNGEFVGVLGACGTTTMQNSYGTPVGPFASSVLGVPTTLTRFGTQFNINTAGANQAYWTEPAAAISRVILGVSAAVGLQYGAGSPSPYAAAPTLKTTQLPILGQSAQLTYTNNDALAIGLVVAGVGRANVPTPFGTLLIGSIDFIDTLNGGAPIAPGSYTYSFAIPNNPALQGLGPLNWQGANIVIPTGEFALSNATEWWLSS
jgi:PKD repeat protein